MWSDTICSRVGLCIVLIYVILFKCRVYHGLNIQDIYYTEYQMVRVGVRVLRVETEDRLKGIYALQKKKSVSVYTNHANTHENEYLLNNILVYSIKTICRALKNNLHNASGKPLENSFVKRLLYATHLHLHPTLSLIRLVPQTQTTIQMDIYRMSTGITNTTNPLVMCLVNALAKRHARPLSLLHVITPN